MDARDERLLGRVGMGVVVVVLVLVHGPIQRQALDPAVLGELDTIDVHRSVDDLASKATKPVRGVVARHAGVHSVVPPVYSADQVCAGDVAVGQPGAAVATSAGQHAVVLVPPDDDEVDAIDEARCRSPISELIPFDDFHRVDELGCAVDG